MAVDVSALEKATLALAEPTKFRHRARVFAVRGNSVAFDRTNFFPNLSGQPCDHGRIVRTSDDEKWNVINVNFDGRDVWHDIDGSLNLRTEDEVECCVDELRRKLFCRSHTAAVLVSGLAHREWNGCLVTSCNLSCTHVRLDFSGGLRSRNEVEGLLAKANEVISDDGEVATFMITSEAAHNNLQYLRSRILEGHFDSMGPLARVVYIVSLGRIVEQQYDLGTHVHSLREIGTLRLGTTVNRPPIENKGVDHFRVRFCLVDR